MRFPNIRPIDFVSRRDRESRERYKDSNNYEYTIGIVGSGGVGQKTLENLVKLSEPETDYRKIKEVYFFYNTSGKSSDKKDKYEGFANSLKPTRKMAVNDISAIDFRDFEQYRESIDICVIAIDNTEANKKHKEEQRRISEAPKREIMSENNLGLIKDLAEKFNGYDKSVVIVTNQTDEMTYVFDLYSGIDADKMVGMNQTDTRRFHNFIFDYLRENGQSLEDIHDIEAYMLGSHSPLAFVAASKMRISKVRQELNEIPRYKGFIEYIEAKTRDFGPSIYKSGWHTDSDTADATVDVILSIISETYVVGVSRFCKVEGSRGLFIGYPTFFENFKAIPIDCYSDGWFEGLHYEEKLAFFKGYDHLEQRLD